MQSVQGVFNPVREKVMKKAPKITKDEALEIIELSTSSIETLTKAFEIIAKACADESGKIVVPGFWNDDVVAPVIH